MASEKPPEGPLLKKARLIVEETAGRFSHSAFDLRMPMRRQIGYRTPHQILASGKTFAGAQCIDATATIAAVLKEKGYDVWVATEWAYYRGKRISLHHRVEATDGQVKFTVDPHSPNIAEKTEFYDWWYSEQNLDRKGRWHYNHSVLSHEGLWRSKVPDGAMDRTAFDLVGVKDHREWLKEARVNLF